VAEHSDAVLVAIWQAAPQSLKLRLRPAQQATARFGLVTLADRTEHPALAVVRPVMQDRLRDSPPLERRPLDRPLWNTPGLGALSILHNPAVCKDNRRAPCVQPFDGPC